MSDVMLIGVLRMPYEMAMGSTLSQMQYHSRGLEAAERILADEARIESLERENARLRDVLQDAVKDVDENGRYTIHWWYDDAKEALA